MGISAYQLAKALHLPGTYEIVREQRSISADVALRLGKYFGMTPQFWMNLQTDYDVRLTEPRAPLDKIKPRSAPRIGGKSIDFAQSAATNRKLTADG
jgi:addiction module HigA family antidote